MLRRAALGGGRLNWPRTHQGASLGRAAAPLVCRARSIYSDAVAAAANTPYLESLYAQWRRDPSKLDARWDSYFRSVEAGDGKPAPVRVAADPSVVDLVALKYLIGAFQVRGHEAARLDPLGQHQWRGGVRIAELTPEFYGFTAEDLQKKITGGGGVHRGSTGGNTGFLAGVAGVGNLGFADVTLGEFLDRIRSTYCGTLGIEYMHILDRKRCNWIRQRVECPTFLMTDKQKAMTTYKRICQADGFERFLGDKFKNTKRFGIDGGEAVVPGLEALVDRGVDLGIEDFVFGMPHRGRLNVLVNVLGKPMPRMLAEFMGTAYNVDAKIQELNKDDWSSAGDVKYHLGTSSVREYPDAGSVTLTLEANPSHLETVGPVALGRTRAKQYYLGDTEDSKKRVMPILLHGDASFAGQGVVYESMQLARVEDFDVGGTVHIIVNNQVGFTTDPRYSRSTEYCSDLGKAFGIPIFHCNADDPVAVVRAFEMATEWRQEWGDDVILDVVCYRRFGHNESDNPEFTQPLLYKAIGKQRRSVDILAESLVKDGMATQAELEGINKSVWDKFEVDYNAAQDFKPTEETEWLATKWEGVRRPNEQAQKLPTAVDVSLLKRVGARLCTVPDGFQLHNSLKRILKNKQERIEAGEGLDWGTAEALAIGTLLLEGTHVRITGQDVQRGTFSHRHCVVHDQKTSENYVFLNNLNLGPQETFTARNSILAEYAVLGFELGYSYENPNSLTIWEAQFGDFANTAQVMFDQFICAGEHKWLQQSALTVLLPHGYDGQGAEHSSARIERFLQLCDDDEDDVPNYAEAGTAKQVQKSNWQVLNLSTPANYFHALRQQLHRDFRKPLIIAAPKALLRHKLCVSSLQDMGPGAKFQRLIPERDPAIAGSPAQVKRLVFCSGKIYFELLAKREELRLKNVALVTVEMIAPFPFNKVKEQLGLYTGVNPGDGVHPGDVIWCQEEPKNMGAWSYVRPRIITVAREALGVDLVIRYVGRRASASPATGIGKLHTAEQEAVIHEALVGREEDGRPRPTALLGHQT